MSLTVLVIFYAKAIFTLRKDKMPFYGQKKCQYGDILTFKIRFDLITRQALQHHHPILR